MGYTDIRQLLPKNVYDAAIGANSPSAANVYATMADVGGASSTFQTLTVDALLNTIDWDYSLGYNAKVTMTGAPVAKTLNTPTNVSNGDYGTLVIDTGALPGYSLVLPASFKVVNGGAGAITITVTPGAIDVISWVYDGTNFLVSFGLNFT